VAEISVVAHDRGPTNCIRILCASESAQADLAAQAHPITDATERRRIFTRVLSNVGRAASELPAWEAGSPLVEVTFDEA